MTINEFFILVASISVAVVAFSAVPALLQCKRAFKRMETFFDEFNSDFKPLAKSISDAASEIELLATTLNEKTEKSDKIINTIKHSADTLKMATDLIKDAVIPVVASAGGIRAGIKAFTYFLTKSYKP